MRTNLTRADWSKLSITSPQFLRRRWVVA